MQGILVINIFKHLSTVSLFSYVIFVFHLSERCLCFLILSWFLSCSCMFILHQNAVFSRLGGSSRNDYLFLYHFSIHFCSTGIACSMIIFVPTNHLGSQTQRITWSKQTRFNFRRAAKKNIHRNVGLF